MAKSKKTPAPVGGVGGERRKLRAEEVAQRLGALGGWSLARSGAIERTYVLPGFRAALSFVAFVGELAEAKSHHPDIDIRYNRVTLRLSTHDAGGITAKDFELARLVDSAS